jgi:hypothetical protein
MSDPQTTPAATNEKDAALAAAEEKAKRVRAAVAQGAEEVARHLGKGIRSASRALDAPTGTAVEGLLSDSNLPELAGDDPIAELALRLDREADLWRNLALRNMARLAWADRIAQAVAVVAVACDIALAAVAAIAALFGGDAAGGRFVLLGTAAAIVVAGALVVNKVSSGIRATQAELAHAALGRAEIAEAKLHRVGIALGWRKVDLARYQEALGRLEHDGAAPAAK